MGRASAGRGRGRGGARARFAGAGGQAGRGASAEGVVVDERPLAVLQSLLWMKVRMLLCMPEAMNRTTFMHTVMERETGVSSSLGITSSARSASSVAGIGSMKVTAMMTGDWRQNFDTQTCADVHPHNECSPDRSN